MVFSSTVFLFMFLPLTLLGYFVIKENYRNYWLLLISLIFFGWSQPNYLWIIVLNIVINYCAAMFIGISRKFRKLVLVSAVIANILILFYFKYFDFTIESINEILGLSFDLKGIILPIGISFFIFQAMSYVIDVYREECPVEKNIFNVALYISFFPQLIAGPIIKYKDIGCQIKNRRETLDGIALGMRRFCYGLGKKVIISNALAEVVDKIAVMDIGNVDGSMAWIIVIFYSLQIYYDFSGYSDMAIGLGRIFGFDIPENFQYPYLSTTINEFWRKWHISLGTWFREYVYIPLGGNRKGSGRTYINLFIVFLLTGIWHGASWNFVFWGAYHGFFIIMERLGIDKILKKSSVFSHVYTVCVFGIGWIFFRFTSMRQGFAYLKRIFVPWKYTYAQYSIFEIVSHRAWMILILAIAGCGIVQGIAAKYFDIQRFKAGKLDLIYCTVIVWICFGLLAGNTYNPFIYFRF